MKKLLTLLLSLCLCVTFIIPCIAEETTDYTDLPNYEPMPEFTDLENHERWKEHKGMMSVEALQYQIDKAGPDDFIFTGLSLNDYTDCIEFIQQYAVEDIKVHKVGENSMTLQIRKSIIDEVLNHEAVTYYAYGLAIINGDPFTTGMPFDITGDEVTTLKDASRFLQYLAGWDVELDFMETPIKLSDERLQDYLDLNGDFLVNMKDVAYLIRDIAVSEVLTAELAG